MNCKIRGSLSQQQNPKWPPKLGTLILIDHPNNRDNLFVGTVNEYLFDGKAVLILLMNNKNYNDISLEHTGAVQKGTSTLGMLMLSPIHGWRYVDLNKFNKEFGSCVGEIIGPTTQAELTIGSTYEDPSLSKYNKCNDDDKFKDTSLLNEKGDLQMEDLFREKDINQKLYNNKEKFRPPEVNIKKILLSKLALSETISKEESKIIVNKNIAIKNMIDTKEDEINEGNKIIDWLKKNMIDVNKNINIFGDLKMCIFNGYIHLARVGLKVDDVINKNDLPDLNFFKWQYGIPIDYDTLKYILFQSDFQNKITRDIEEQKEAEKIFAQEYIISLQPEPQYQIWTLKRLIMAWYADDVLQNNIRKIKIIINQYRCRSDKEFNQKYGILPSIVIYPRYGKESGRKVLTLISHYFMLYQTIGWNCAKPSYFIKVNDLVWYTNGSIDIKLYFTKALGSYDGKSKNKSFNDYFTSIASADRLIYPYEPKK